MDELIRSQYPKEMTIVLQNQFSDLKVGAAGFSVTLKFSRVPYVLEIPFAAVTYFGDPSVRFGISFGSELDSNTPEAEAAPARKTPTWSLSTLFGKTAMLKKSVIIAGRHYTSISLEKSF